MISNSTDMQAEWPRLRERLLSFVRSRVSHPADAEDLLHDVFVRMQQSIDELDDELRFDAWLFRITRNAIIDYYRANDRRRSAMDAFIADPSDAATWSELGKEDEGQARRQLSRCVAPLVDKLPHKYRQAIRLTDLGDLSQTDAAERLDLSVSGMKSRVQRGREHLKGLLLECCNLELDHRGELMRVEPGPGCCGDSEDSPCAD